MQQPISFAPSAQASSSGTATFTVPSVPISQTWIGTLSIPGAPSSASFSALIGGLSSGNWIGQNTFGPITIPQNLNLQVTATSLTPGQSYQLNFQGTVYTSEEALPSFAFPAATPVTQQTLQTMNLLGTGVAAIGGESVTITIDPTWRSIWVILNPNLGNAAGTAGITPTLQGTTTQNYFEGLQPPYLTFNSPTWAFTRFPLIYGPDTVVTLTIPPVNVITAGSTFWYGYDTQPVDIAVYDESVAITTTVVQPTAANLNARVSQPTAANLNATVVQATAANLQAQVSQSTAANLNNTPTQSTAMNLLGQLRQTGSFGGFLYQVLVPTYNSGGVTKITQAATTSRAALLSSPTVASYRLHSISISGGVSTNYCQLWDASSGGNLLVTINALSNTLMLEGLLETTTGIWLIGSTTGMSITLCYDILNQVTLTQS